MNEENPQAYNKESVPEHPVAFEVIGESEETILRALSKDQAGKPGLINFLDMVREFGHSGSSIDKIGYGRFVLKTEKADGIPKIVGVDFVPRDEWQEKNLPSATRGRYKFSGAEIFIRELARRMYERIEQVGSEMAKENWLTHRNETTETLAKWYPDAQEGIIEFDYNGSAEITNFKYTAKSVNRKGEVISSDVKSELRPRRRS